MVTIAPIVASRGLDVGSAPSTARDDSIGAALRGVGNTVSRIGDQVGEQQLRLVKQQQQMEEFRTEQAWEQTKLDIAAKYDDARTNIDPSGAGFAENVNKAFIGQYDTFLRSVPENLRPRFAELVKTDKEGRLLQAAADEVTQRNTWYEVGVTDTIGRKQTEVAAYPELFDQTLADVQRTIDASGLPPAKKADLKRSAENMLGTAWFERMMRDDPGAAKTMLGVGDVGQRDDYFAAIRGAESGGNDNAANPNSSARGRYQFIDSTWNRLVKAYPDAGLTKDGRGNGGQEEIAIRLLTAENEKALASAGIRGTNANLYAAHFLGAQGAATVLKAPDDAALASYVAPEVITANPFLKGMTVGRFKAWAADKVGQGTTEPAPQVASLPFGDRLKLYDQAVAAENALITQTKAANKLAYDAEKGALELSIAKGELASAQSILESHLDDADKATLLGKFNTEQGKDRAARSFVDAYAAGTLGKVNPYNADDRKVVGDAYDLLMKATPEQDRLAATANFVERTGIVPPPVVATVRQSLNANDVAAVAAGLQQAAALYDVAPDSIATVENGKDIQDAAATYREMSNRGLSAEQAAAEVIRLRDPAQKQKADLLDPAWDQAVKDKAFKVDDVLAAFDGGWFGGGYPSAGVTPQQSAALEADYLSAAERHFKGAANGDTALAKALAVEDIKRTYGVSETSGARTLMKFAPELYFPARAGGHGYIRDLAMQDARSIYPEAANIMLVATPAETAADVQAGRAPRYDLYYQRPDGVWDLAPDLFTIDPKADAELSRLDSEEARLKFEAARQLKEQQDAMPLYGSGGMAQPLYGGGNYTTPLAQPPAPAADIPNRMKAVEEQRKAILGLSNADKPAMATSDPLEAERRWLELNSSTFGMMGGAPK